MSGYGATTSSITTLSIMTLVEKVVPNTFKQCVIMLSVLMKFVIMMSVITVSIVMLCVIMPNFVNAVSNNA
jgi:hypothetical protein